MTEGHPGSEFSGPLAWIAIFAVVVGGFSFALGFFGPVLLDWGNQGPLLGIFVTGPYGALAGALAGCLAWAWREPGGPTAAVWKWMAGILLANLLFTLWMVGITSWFLVPGAAVQASTLCGIVFLLYHSKTRSRIPAAVRRCGPVAIAVVAFIFAMTLFPPVTRPWWGKPPAAAVSTLTPTPMVAFVLHTGFDADRRIPLFAVDRRVLALEWTVALIAGAMACALVTRHTRSGGTPRNVAPA